jgi:hypothetical protein
LGVPEWGRVREHGEQTPATSSRIQVYMGKKPSAAERWVQAFSRICMCSEPPSPSILEQPYNLK